MATEVCPTCGQPLPKGLLRSELLTKIEEDRRRAGADAVARASRRLRREIEADLHDRISRQAYAKARRELAPTISRAKQEGKRERDQELRTKERELKDAQRQLALAEAKRKELEDTVRKLGRKIHEASPQRIGKVSQDEIRRLLEIACHGDQIAPVPGGTRGADILQHVCENGEVCGKILWEVKDSIMWSETYAAKAKRDGQSGSVDYICVVTTSFPKGLEGLARRNGVMLVAPHYVSFLAAVLRDAVVELHHTRLSGQQRSAKAAVILDYVTGPDCKAKFDVIADSVDGLRKIQANEKNYHEEHWRKEEEFVGKVSAASGAIRTRLSAIARETPVRLVAKA